MVHTHARRALPVPFLLALLAGCGAGTAAIAASSDSGSSSNNAPSSITGLTVDPHKEAPATLHFVLSDRESNPATVTFYYDVGAGPVMLTQLSANPMTLDTTPAGMPHPVFWPFPGEADLPDDATFLADVTIMADVAGGNLESITTGLGNDAPVVEDIAPIPAEVEGNVGVLLTVSDSSDDVISVTVEYDVVGDANSWLPATPALGQNTLENVQVFSSGTLLTFFWDTDLDLGATEQDVRLRFTPEDELIPGDPFETLPFAVDNNEEPIAVLSNDLLITSPDETRGIAIPFRLVDEESDDVRVVLQWRREGQDFPSLSGYSRDQLVELLDDPTRADERRALQICTEQPLFVGGRVQPPPAGLDPTLHVTLPELATSAASVLAGGVEGRTIEILRASTIPEPAGIDGLTSPVAALPLENGPTAIVLEDLGGGWSLREIDLATGEVVDGHEATGRGTPTAMDDEPESGAVVVASHQGGNWRVARVDRETWTTVPLVSASNGDVDSGPVRGLLSLGTQVSVITVGDSLVRLDYPPDAGVLQSTGLPGQSIQRNPEEPLEPPRASLMLDGFATPWGLALDPLQANRIYLAERDYAHTDGRVGRIATVELDTYIVEEVFTLSTTMAGSGFDRPTAIALERSGARVLTLTDANPGDGMRELRGTNINGNEPGRVFELTDGLPDDAATLGVGPDQLRVVALPSDSDLALGGGVEQRRTVAAYVPAQLTLSVTEPFDPMPEPNALWRMRESVTRSGPEGLANVFVWDSADVPEATVFLRVLPLDTDLGLADEGEAPKTVRMFDGGVSIGGITGVNIVAGRWVAAADLNQDGRPDLAKATHNAIEVFYQDESGAFSPTRSLQLRGINQGANPMNLKAADLNADQRTDLVFANTKGVQIFIQPESGFHDGQEASCNFGKLFDPGYHGSGANGHIVVADLDRDGLLDVSLAPLHHVPDRVRIFFQSLEEQSGSCPFPADPQLELEDPTKISWPFYMQSGDVDGDGCLDLVLGNTGVPGPTGIGWWTVLYQIADSMDRLQSFTESSSLLRRVLRSSTAEVADLNGDGRLDVVSANMPILMGDSVAGKPSTVMVFFQSATRTGWFEEEPSLVLKDEATIDGALFPILEDFDGDGRIDILTQNFNSSNLTVFLQTSLGHFNSVPDLIFEHRFLDDTWGADAVDLHGDGRLDVVMQSQSNGKITIFDRNVPGRFKAPPDLELGVATLNDRPESLLAADLNGDGRLDLGSANSANDNLTIFFQTSAGRYSAEPEVVLDGTRPRSVCAGDLDGDADLELLAANARRGEVTLFAQTAPGLFQMDPEILGGGAATAGTAWVGVADLDGDGALDVVSANPVVDTLTIYENSSFHGSDGELSSAPVPGVQLTALEMVRPGSVVLVDLDADGDIDIVSANETSNNLTLFRNPDSGFSSAEGADLVLGETGVTDDPRSIVAADLDADGWMDLASASFDNGFLGENPGVAVFFQGALGFESLVLEAPMSPRSLVAADIDGDGDQDLISANSLDPNIGGSTDSANAVALYRQTTPRHFSAPLTLAGPGGGAPAVVLPADWNSDGEVDIAVGLHIADASNTGLLEDKIVLYFNGQ